MTQLFLILIKRKKKKITFIYFRCTSAWFILKNIFFVASKIPTEQGVV